MYMPDFNEIGFLSSSLDGFEEQIKQAFPEHYEYILKINRFCHPLQYELDIHRDNVDELTSAILFSRTLATYQAFILVAKRGMLQQTKMLLRCMLESLFPLVAISKQKGYALKLIGSEDYERLRTYKKLLGYYESNDPNNPKIEEIRQKAEEVKHKISKHNFKRITVAQEAQHAGLKDWYDTAYPLFSMTVHASVRSLEDALVLDDQKNIRELKSEPELHELDHLFTTAIEVMKFAIIALSEIFKIDVNRFVENLSKKLSEFAKDLHNESIQRTQ